VNGKEYFWLVDSRNNCLLWFSATEGAKVEKHCFDYEGPEGIGEIVGVSRGTSSEVLFTSSKPGHYFFDPEKKNVRKVELKSRQDSTFTSGNFTSNYYEDYSVIGDTGYFMQTAFLQVTNVGRRFPNYKMVAGTSHKTWETNLSGFTFPADYHQEKQLMPFPSLTGDDDKLVVSILMDNRLHSYSPSTGILRVHDVKSKYFPDEFPEIVNDDGQDREEYFAVHPYYTAILYDRYRDLYYRIAKVPAGEDLNHIQARKNTYFWNPRQFSIMVLDASLKVQDEFLLPADTYVLKNMAVTEKGLTISRMHPMNDENNVEDQISFDVFLYSN